MENNKSMNNEPKTAEEAIRLIDEILQGIGEDDHKPIKNVKYSFQENRQTAPPAMHQNSKFNINKPRLEDYNVTQEMYDYEIKKYLKEKEIIVKEYHKRDYLRLGVIFILVIVIGVVILPIGTVSPNPVGAGLLIFSPFITLILSGIISDRKGSQKKLIALNEIYNSIKASIIIQKYKKYLYDLKYYEVELAKYQKRIQMEKEKYWTDMEGHKFEKEIAALFSNFGYNSKVTKGSGDGGVDIILIKNNKKYYVQCKNHGKPVGPAVARELLGAMSHDGIIYGVIVSPEGFTKSVYDFVKGKNIKLMSKKEILEMVDHIK